MTPTTPSGKEDLATPRPWKWDEEGGPYPPCFDISAPGNGTHIIARFYGQDAEANAKHTLESVNEREGLLKRVAELERDCWQRAAITLRVAGKPCELMNPKFECPCVPCSAVRVLAGKGAAIPSAEEIAKEALSLNQEGEK